MSSKYLTKLSSISEDIDIRDIVLSPNNLRNETNDIQSLIDSVGNIGLLQNIVVRTVDDHYEIIAGVRRYHACRKLGWKKIPCNIVELDSKTAFEISLVENIQRHSLTVLQECTAFKKYVTDFGWGSISDLAKKLSKSPSYISKRMRLLELPAEVLKLISESEIEISTAEELLTIKDKLKQHQMAVLVHGHHLSSKQVRQMVNKNSAYDDHNIDTFLESEIDFQSYYPIEDQYVLLRSIDKAIIALKDAVRKLISLIQNDDEKWILNEVLRQHKNMLVTQIDILIKQRRKALRVLHPRYL